MCVCVWCVCGEGEGGAWGGGGGGKIILVDSDASNQSSFIPLKPQITKQCEIRKFSKITETALPTVMHNVPKHILDIQKLFCQSYKTLTCEILSFATVL